jgi:hypothetical protein
MNTKLKLIQLRQENCGYNPEKASDIGSVTDLGSSLFITHEDHTMVFTLTECKDQLNFIENYAGHYGVIHNNRFYIQD